MRLTPVRPIDSDPLLPPRRRLEWVDVARGIGIVLVVYGHALRGLQFDAQAPAPAWNLLQYRLIYAFHMPFFFLLAGLFLERSIAHGRRRFLIEKLLTVAWPYLLWSLIGGGFKLLAGGLANHPLSLAEIEMIPIAPIEQYWFLYCLFFIQLLIGAILPRRWLLVAAAAIGVILAFRFGLRPISTRGLFYLGFTVAGMLGAGLWRRLAEGPVARRAIVGAVAWSLFALVVQPPWTLPVPVWKLYAAGASGTIGALTIAMLLARSDWSRGLAWLGRAAMAIYVAHTLFTAALRIVLVKLHAPIGLVPLTALITAAGLIGPCLLWWASERAGASLIAGFGRGIARPRPPSTPPH